MLNEAVKELTCIICPNGCRLNCIKNSSGVSITGARCPNGKNYAIAEFTNPMRVLTCSVKVEGGEYPVVSARTDGMIPKALVGKAMARVNRIILKAPVNAGDTIIKNIAGAGVDIIATKNIRGSGGRFS